MGGSLRKAFVAAVGVLLGEAGGRVVAGMQPSKTAVPIATLLAAGYFLRKNRGVVGGLGSGMMVNAMIHGSSWLASRFGLPVDPDLGEF